MKNMILVCGRNVSLRLIPICYCKIVTMYEYAEDHDFYLFGLNDALTNLVAI